MAKTRLPIRPLAAIRRVEELPDLLLGADAGFDCGVVAGVGEAELVAPVRHAGFDEVGERGVGFGGGPVGGADGEEVGDEVGVPEVGAVGDCSALF